MPESSNECGARTLRWKLEDGTWVTPEDLAEEITRVPRTRYWRLSHLTFLWPEGTDPEDMDDESTGFPAGFALELVPIEGAVEWLLQPTGGDARDRITGEAPIGRKAVEAAFEIMERWVHQRQDEPNDAAQAQTSEQAPSVAAAGSA